MIEPKDILGTTELEFVWSTTRCLPPEDQIPKEFWQGNQYTKLAEQIFFGTLTDDDPSRCTVRPEFSEVPLDRINQFVRAHLASWSPQHEHKIAGVGYLISQIMEVEA